MSAANKDFLILILIFRCLQKFGGGGGGEGEGEGGGGPLDQPSS